MSSVIRSRFFIGKGRHASVPASRYKHFTYGRTSFSAPTPDIPQQEAHGTYGALLFDEKWKVKRAQIIERDDNACVICQCSENLQVHHRQYHFIKALGKFKAPWDYEDHLLITLCERCHARGHNKYKVPNIYL